MRAKRHKNNALLNLKEQKISNFTHIITAFDSIAIFMVFRCVYDVACVCVCVCELYVSRTLSCTWNLVYSPRVVNHFPLVGG